MSVIKNSSRRKFFLTAGISAAGVALLNKLPFVKSKRSALSGRKINISINPSAVKRTK